MKNKKRNFNKKYRPSKPSMRSKKFGRKTHRLNYVTISRGGFQL